LPSAASSLSSTGGIVLPDASWADRDVPLSVKGRSTGAIVVGTGPGRVLQTDSHLELKVALVLAARRDVDTIEEQVAFPWRDRAGKDHTHFFDFRVTLVTGRRVAITVKAAAVVAKGRFLPTFRPIAQAVTPAFADEVRLMTDRDLDPVDLANATLFHAYRVPDPEADAAAAQATEGLVGAARLHDLTEATGLGSRGYRALVRRVHHGQLVQLTRERISAASLVRRSEGRA
jgi:hypothetical protein